MRPQLQRCEGPGRFRVTVACVGLALALVACDRGAAPAPEDPLRGELRALEARVSAALAPRRDELDPGHRMLIGEPPTGAELEAFLEPVELRRFGGMSALGVSYAPESHGGGLLALILSAWRPEGRPASLDDAWRFAMSGEAISLRALYEAHRFQLFFPLEGVRPEAIDGRLPPTSAAPLPRFAFRYGPSDPIRHSDAYHVLGLMLAHEADRGRRFENFAGQSLDLEGVVARVQAHYLGRTVGDLPRDHSVLHLPAWLVRAAPGVDDAHAFARHFVAVELRTPEPDDADGAERLAHAAENLGELLASERVRWSEAERAELRRWLAALDRPLFRQLDALPAPPLAHLVRGLRIVDAEWERLGP